MATNKTAKKKKAGLSKLRHELPKYVSAYEMIWSIIREEFRELYLFNTENNLLNTTNDPDLNTEVQERANQLKRMTKAELVVLYEEILEKADQRRRQDDQADWEYFQSKLLWNLPEAKLDKSKYNYWGSMPVWKAEEAAALLLKKNPRIISLENVENAPLYDGRVTQFNEDYTDIYLLIRRSIDAVELSLPIKPPEFISWADSKGINVPNELRVAVKNHPGKTKDWEAEYKTLQSEMDEFKKQIANNTEPKESTRQTDNYKRMIAKLSLALFGRDKQPSAKAIDDQFKKLQINVEPKYQTLNKILPEGLKLLNERLIKEAKDKKGTDLAHNLPKPLEFDIEEKTPE